MTTPESLPSTWLAARYQRAPGRRLPASAELLVEEAVGGFPHRRGQAVGLVDEVAERAL